LNRAAAVSIRSAEGMESEVDYGDQSRLAAMLAQSPPEGKQVVIDAMDVYAEDLDAVGVDDAEMVDSLESGRRFTMRLLWNIILGILLLPFATIGLLINALPMALLWLVGRIKAAPAMMATVKPLAAIVLFGITWAVFIWRVAMGDGLGGSAIWVVLLPLYLFALLAVVERVQLIWRALSGWVRSRRSGLRDVILEHRRDVVQSVADAL
jgi:hypothetical protein